MTPLPPLQYQRFEKVKHLFPSILAEKVLDKISKIIFTCSEEQSSPSPTISTYQKKPFVESLHEKFYSFLQTHQQVPVLKSGNVIAKGGFGHVYESTLIFKSQNSQESTISTRNEMRVISKHIKPASKENGTEVLNELAIMTFISGTPERHSKYFKYLMPSLYTSFDDKTSTVHICLPPGISDVAKVVRKRGIKLKEQTLRKWSSEIVSAVFSLHSVGIAHGDIKPGNVIIFPDGFETEEEAEIFSTFLKYSLHLLGGSLEREEICFLKDLVSELLIFTTVRLSDFGLSSFCNVTKDEVIDQGTGGYSYTSFYRPPEVWKRNRWGLSADIWALGCTFYEMDTNKILFPDPRTLTATSTKPTAIEERRANIEQHESFLRSFNYVEIVNNKTYDKQPDIYTSYRVVGACVQISPFERICVQDLCEHPFFDQSIIAQVSKISFFKNDIFCSQSNERSSLQSSPALTTSSPRFLFLRDDDENVKNEISERSDLLLHNDPIISNLVKLLVFKIVKKQKSIRSLRIRRMSLDMLISFCGCILSKTTKRFFTFRTCSEILKTLSYTATIGNNIKSKKSLRKATSDEESTAVKTNSQGISSTLLPPCVARDEKLLCKAIDFEIFPFEDLIVF